MKRAIGIGIFVLAGIPCGAHAQSPSPAAEQVEAGADVFQNSITKFSFGMDCAELASLQKGFQKEADAYARLSDGFGKIGKVVTLITAGAQAAQGKYVDATQTLGQAVLDEQVCLILGTAACVGWTGGQFIGGKIKQQPWPFDPQGRTIEDVVTDKEVEWLLPYLDQPMNVENMRAAFAIFQSRQADLKRRKQEAAQAGAQCKKLKAKTAVEDILATAKAKAAAARMTPLDSGLIAETDAAINAGRAGADGAITAGSAQFISTMQAAQQQALQEQLNAQALRAQQQQVQQQALQPSSSTSTPVPPKQCVEWAEVYQGDIDRSQPYTTTCVRWSQ